MSCIQGSGRPSKLNTEMIKIIKEKMKEDDNTTATQMVKLLEDKRYKVSRTTIIRARKALGWNFHGSQCCHMLQINGSHFSVKVNIGYPLTLIA